MQCEIKFNLVPIESIGIFVLVGMAVITTYVMHPDVDGLPESWNAKCNSSAVLRGHTSRRGVVHTNSLGERSSNLVRVVFPSPVCSGLDIE